MVINGAEPIRSLLCVNQSKSTKSLYKCNKLYLNNPHKVALEYLTREEPIRIRNGLNQSEFISHFDSGRSKLRLSNQKRALCQPIRIDKTNNYKSCLAVSKHLALRRWDLSKKIVHTDPNMFTMQHFRESAHLRNE